MKLNTRKNYFCKMKYSVFFLAFILLSCEKKINIQPDTQKPLLVVDGNIENGKDPVVILSKSIEYFSSLNTNAILNSLVKNATVTLSNGSKTIKLKQYSLSFGGGYSIVYYTNDSTNPSAAIKGELGKRYTLQIDFEGQKYVSTTSIPLVKRTCDSVWWKKAPFTDDSSKVVLMGRFTDPKGYGNYVRYFTKVNSDNYLPGINSVFDDQVIDGSTYDFQVDQGVDRNNIPDQKEYGYFKRGDTISLKLSNIDKASFDFWRTLEFSYQSVGNPFSSPTKVMSNVSNGALGAFCGYGSQVRTVIVPK